MKFQLFFFMKKAKHDYDIYYLITTLFTRFRHDLPDIYRIHYSCNFLSISCKQCINCQNHVEIRYSVSILSFSCIKSIKVLKTLKSSNTDSWIFWPFSISNKLTALNLNQRMFIPLWNYGKAIAIDVCGTSSVDFSINVDDIIKCGEQKELQVFSEMQWEWCHF